MRLNQAKIKKQLRNMARLKVSNKVLKNIKNKHCNIGNIRTNKNMDMNKQQALQWLQQKCFKIMRVEIQVLGLYRIRNFKKRMRLNSAKS